MKINIKSVLIILVIITLSFGFWNLKRQNQNTSIQNEKVVLEYKANLAVNDGKNNPNFDASQYIGKTVLEATQILLDGNVKTTGSGEKTFITSLNGRDTDSKKREFWELLVNGKQAGLGAGSLKIQNNDNVVWKISTY